MFNTKRRRAAEAREATRERAEREARDNRERLDYAKIHLEELGYEPHETEDDIFGGIEVAWKLTGKQRKANEAESRTRAEALAKAIDDARADERRVTLATVIDALELKEYRKPNPAGFPHISLLGGDGQPKRDVDRFWADLQTTLELRDERATAEERKAAEARVSGLTQDTHRIGDRVAFVFAKPGFDITAPTVADITPPNATDADPATVDFDMADCG